MLRNPPGKIRVEVEMKMTGQNSFDQRFVCQTIEERECGVIRPLLAITVITVRLQQFFRRADKVGAFALPVDHHFVVKLVGMERIVKEQDDRIAACNLGFKSFKFLFPLPFFLREIISATYEHVTAAGDRHVRFLDGELLFGAEERDACTVDGCHPNDLGFYRMYRTMLPVLAEMLGL